VVAGVTPATGQGIAPLRCLCSKSPERAARIQMGLR